MEQMVIFDGDDTLWSTEALYDTARQRARTLVMSIGIDGELWEAAERRLDVENVAVLGMSAQRFPTSCLQALEKVAAESGIAVPSNLRQMVLDEASSVFQAEAPLLPGAREVLGEVSQHHLVVLLTKGDADVQTSRVASSGLADLFSHVEIVDEKSPATFGEIARRFAIDTRWCTSIGNSMRSDIRPAVEAGMRGIWIEAHVWEYERAGVERFQIPAGVVVAGSLFDVPRALGLPAPTGALADQIKA